MRYSARESTVFARRRRGELGWLLLGVENLDEFGRSEDEVCVGKMPRVSCHKHCIFVLRCERSAIENAIVRVWDKVIMLSIWEHCL